MEVEAAAFPGHDAPVLARQLVEAIEAKVRGGDSYAAINRRAGFSRGYVDKLRAAVATTPEHVISSDVAERLAKALGLRLVLEPDPDAGDGP